MSKIKGKNKHARKDHLKVVFKVIQKFKCGTFLPDKEIVDSLKPLGIQDNDN